MLPDVAPDLLVAGHGVHVLPVDRDVEVVQRVQPVERVGALGGSWKWRSWLTKFWTSCGWSCEEFGFVCRRANRSELCTCRAVHLLN